MGEREKKKDTSTTDKLDILLPIRIQIVGRACDRYKEWIVDFSLKHVCEIMKKVAERERE